MKSTILTILFTLFAGLTFGQNPSFPKPRKEKLLNNLNVLIWQIPNAQKLSISLRVHSGSAFDPNGKEGAAKLLTEIMFPDSGIFEDFEDDLGGTLKVSSNHDFVQIDMTVSPDKLVEVLGILAGAVTNPQINKESAADAIKRRKQVLLANSEDPKAIADHEVAKRLYGSFPYGRSSEGTTDSLPRIHYADIIFAKERFLTADNATLTISGDIDSTRAYRAARRMLGGWNKSNGKVPSNFTLPVAPDSAQLVVNTDFGTGTELRIAVEAVKRGHADYYSARILESLLNARLKKTSGGSVELKSFLLRGYLVFRHEYGPNDLQPPEISSSGPSNQLSRLLAAPITSDEFLAAQSEEIANFKNRSLSDHWFDVTTYKLKSIDDEFKKLRDSGLENVLRLAKQMTGRTFVRVSVMPLDAPPPVNDGDPDDPR